MTLEEAKQAEYTVNRFWELNKQLDVTNRYLGYLKDSKYYINLDVLEEDRVGPPVTIETIDASKGSQVVGIGVPLRKALHEFFMNEKHRIEKEIEEL